MASRSSEQEPEETIAFPDWVMLDRMGHTSCHNDNAAAHEAVHNDDTAAAVHTSSGHSCYFSFVLAAPPKVSYPTLHWPGRPADKPGFHLPAYLDVMAADDNLVLLRVSIESRSCFDGAPSDLFVYAAGPPSSVPSALRLPVPAEPAEDLAHGRRTFLVASSVIGILRLAAAAAGDQERGYIVAELDIFAKKKRVSPRRRRTEDSENSGNGSTFARLCVFSSETGNWRIITKRVPRSNGGQVPAFWSAKDVLPLGGRFLCWVDYFHGLLISDFSTITSPALFFMPFPGKQYSYDNIREPTRSSGGTFRSVAVSQGRMRFVHIDNDFHDKDEWNRCSDCSERKRRKLGTKITTWTLKIIMDGGSSSLRFEWEVHRVINLECLWAQIGYQDQDLPRRLPQFPVIASDDPDVLCCMLGEEEYRGKEWMIMVDMKYAYLRSSTSCVNAKPNRNCFGYVPLVPSVISKYLQRPTRS